MPSDSFKQHLWQKGQSGNPGGKYALPPELKGIRSLSQIEACKVISKYARMNKAELRAVCTKDETPVLELAIASIFAKCIETGDHSKLTFLLDRSIGRIPEIKETDEDVAARQELHSLSDQELAKIIRERLPELEASKE